MVMKAISTGRCGVRASVMLFLMYYPKEWTILNFVMLVSSVQKSGYILEKIQKTAFSEMHPPGGMCPVSVFRLQCISV